MFLIFVVVIFGLQQFVFGIESCYRIDVLMCMFVMRLIWVDEFVGMWFDFCKWLVEIVFNKCGWFNNEC